MMKSAEISDFEVYRYSLTRYWGPSAMLPFVMLNPSTADADIDDPTIRRCMSFARREGFGGVKVVNLFAFRATKPADMKSAADPFGPLTEQALTTVANHSRTHTTPIVCAWGANGTDAAAARALACLIRGPVRLVCLGKTASGAPRHPLYVRGDQPFEVF
jgi:hypothetical protein